MKKQKQKKPKKKDSGEKTEFFISPLFALLGVILIILGYGIVVFFQFIAVIIHEAAHAIVAKRKGYSLNSIKIMPFGAQLTGKFESVKPKDEILIAIAGPLTNLILGGVFVIIWWLFPAAYRFTEPFVRVNLFMAVFNMLPIFPLDGGRILLAGLSLKHNREKVYKALRRLSLVFAIVFAAVFFVSFFFVANISLGIVSIFFFLSTIFPDKSITYRRIYSMAFRSEKLKRGLLVKEVMVSKNTTLLKMLKMLNANYFYRFIIVDDSFNKIATIDEIKLEKLLMENNSQCTISSLTHFPSKHQPQSPLF